MSRTLSQSQVLRVEYFYVAIDEIQNGYRIFAVPLSPYLRTKDEAIEYLANCGIPGAYIQSCAFFDRSYADHKANDEYMFGSDTQPPLEGALCLRVEKSQTNRQKKTRTLTN